jgi:hypothetical protein
MNKPTSNQTALATDLKDLGFTSIAGRVLEGRISSQSALAHVKREQGVEQRMLDRSRSEGTVEMRERLATWCEKASFVLDHWEAQS